MTEVKNLVMLSHRSATTPVMSAKTDLEGLFRRHEREIFSYMLRLFRDIRVAEDLAQETFERAFTSISSFRGESSLRTWLFAIARNVSVDHIRRCAREVSVAEFPDIANERDPSIRISVSEALDSLPLPYREALFLSDALGFAPGDAALAIGVTPNAFRVRLHRARQLFREVYQSHD